MSFISSLGARAVVGTISAYAATKGAIDTLVKHFASMLGARGIRVNAVAPGVVETDMSSFTKTEAGRDFALGMQAFKRLAANQKVVIDLYEHPPAAVNGFELARRAHSHLASAAPDLRPGAGISRRVS